MVNANVIGWYDRNNIGDESYKLAFPKLFPDITFQFNQDIPSDTCILGGGDILNEEYVKLLVNSHSKQKIILSASARIDSPFNMLKSVDQIFVRDHNSLNLFKYHDIPCTWMPDAAHCLTPNRDHGESLIKRHFHGLELYNKRVGVVMNSHLYRDKGEILARDFLNLNKVIHDLAKLADNTSASFIFFPMSTGMPHDDRILNGMIAGKCKFWKKNLMLYDRLTVQETLDLISSCDAIISSRLHSTIFSLISNVPFIDLTHHDKNLNYLKTVGLECNSVSYWSLSYNEIYRRLVDIIDHKENYCMQDYYNQQRQFLTKESENVHFV